MRRVIMSLLLGISLVMAAQGVAWGKSGGGVNRGGNGGQVAIILPAAGGAGTAPVPSPQGESGGGSGSSKKASSNCRTVGPAPETWQKSYYVKDVWCGGVYQGTILVPIGSGGGGGAPPPPPPPSGAEVAQMALASFTLMTPSIETTADGGVVRFPQWFWLSGGWAEQSATASLRGVSATVVAKPFRALWRPGDGSSFSCDNPGMAYRGPQDAHLRPSCSHAYTRSSALEPGQRYQVTVRVSFHMTWYSTDGTSGDLGTITSPAGSGSAAVGEIQAINVPNPGGAG